MTRARRMWGVLAIGFGLTAVLGGAARAGEEDDLQRQIDTQKSSVADLERLDDLKAVTDEIARLKSWLDEAWGLRAKHEYDQVRTVLDRALKQEDLIRDQITVSKLRAQALKPRSVAEADQGKDRAHPQDLAGDEREEEDAREGSAMRAIRPTEAECSHHDRTARPGRRLRDAAQAA